MGFQVQQFKLSDLVEGTTSGRIQIPDFQRGYVWEDERVRQLLVTVAVGHPLGVLLLLESGSEEVHFQTRRLEGTNGDEAAAQLVLDGQQRLTSLTQALTGEALVTVGNKRASRRYFIDVERALRDPENMSDAIRSMPADGIERTNFNRDIVLDLSTRSQQIKHSCFPVAELFADATAWVFGWASSADSSGVDPQQRLADATEFSRLLENMKSYAIPAIVLDKSTTMAAVTTVFEKVNQGGVKLTVFELLTAKFAGDRRYFDENGHAFRLRDDWERISQELAKHLVLRGFDSGDFLQAITLVASLHRSSATTARKDDVLKLTLDEYREWSPQIVDALTWSASFLGREHIHAPWDLPYPKHLVPLAALRVVLGQEADAYGMHGRLRQWFWCGILGELYGGASETRFARDLEQVPAWVRHEDGAATPGTVESAFFGQSRLLTLRTRNSAAYKGIYALLMAQHAKDWIYNREFEHAQYFEYSVDIHHIFPKAWCEKHGIDSARRESIINKTPLAKRTNIKLSGNAPSVYRERIRKDSQVGDELIDDVIRSHMIEPEHLWSDDFDAFFAARADRLIELVEEAMGKPVMRDIGPDEESFTAAPAIGTREAADGDDDLTMVTEDAPEAVSSQETMLRGQVALDALLD